ncbi:TolC family protein [Desulfobacterales bacterium HSG17]|nr:TolC family protein [Desulfobacterales bacterium HSG17]
MGKKIIEKSFNYILLQIIIAALFIFYGPVCSFFPAPVNVYAQQSADKGTKLMEAVRITLKNQPNIHLMKNEVDIKKGIYQSASGQFDTVLNLAAGYNHEETPHSTYEEMMQGTSETETDTTFYEVNLNKQFRTGVSVTPSIKTTRTDVSDYSQEPKNISRIDFLVTMPLLKGRGRKASAANEMAAEKDYKISSLEMQHTISESILNTAMTFWNFLSAYKRLEQLKNSESRAEILVNETKILIKADKRPAADLEQIMANLADKTASRIAGTQVLFQARQSLGLAMGLAFSEINFLPEPVDEYPEIIPQKISALENISESLIDLSLSRRSDYLASKEKQNIGKIYHEAAKNNLLPNIDLNFNLGYSGLDEGDGLPEYITSMGNNIPGLSCALSINYQWPFKNNTAQGFLLQKKSEYRQKVIASNDLGRNISSSVIVAINGLKASSSELAKAREAVQFYNNAVENEKKKFKLGISTLLDLISMEDRLADVLLNEISAQLKFANAMVRLRFETGSLLSCDQKTGSVTVEEIASIPMS